MISAQILNSAVTVLRQGGLLVYPTETFYAIGADYSQASALNKLLLLKGRGEHHPLPLIIGSHEELANYCDATFNPLRVRRLVESFWPGPLTLVVPADKRLHASLLSPPSIPGGVPGVALRVSSHPVARSLALMVGRAIVSTSANISGQPAASRIADLPREFLAGVDMALDCGPCAGGQPSTILDVRHTPNILRQGALEVPEWCLRV